ncbi:hypothetical protein C4F51_12235 [Cellvibrio sp. KB43]|uniref:Uncharacterized protein n=1 Tax=Cellvibrio polysaccharolyticus TaxID=2082724 RepID=A0A928V376_9GAMM|nr:hypothetical protein [Cellvibrio polysaccharolyticus]
MANRVFYGGCQSGYRTWYPVIAARRQLPANYLFLTAALTVIGNPTRYLMVEQDMLFIITWPP